MLILFGVSLVFSITIVLVLSVPNWSSGQSFYWYPQSGVKSCSLNFWSTSHYTTNVFSKWRLFTSSPFNLIPALGVVKAEPHYCFQYQVKYVWGLDTSLSYSGLCVKVFCDLLSTFIMRLNNRSKPIYRCWEAKRLDLHYVTFHFVNGYPIRVLAGLTLVPITIPRHAWWLLCWEMNWNWIYHVWASYKVRFSLQNYRYELKSVKCIVQLFCDVSSFCAY